MKRPPVPEVIRDLYRDPDDARTLLVAALSLAAAGLDPRVFSPGLVSVQEAVRARPEVEQLLLIAAVVGALVLLVGGVLGDTDGRRRIQIGALGLLVITGLSGLFITDGPLFLAGRLVGAISASIILPFALAGVAVTYQGIPRATAIGFAYAAFGAGTAAGPVLLTLFGPSGPRWPAFVACDDRGGDRVRHGPPPLAGPADAIAPTAAAGHRHRRLGGRDHPDLHRPRRLRPRRHRCPAHRLLRRRARRGRARRGAGARSHP